MILGDTFYHVLVFKLGMTGAFIMIHVFLPLFKFLQ